MITLSRVAAPALALAVCLFGSAPASAESTVLSGMFDGSEPIMAALWSNYCSSSSSGYRQTDFTVSTNGNYSLQDAFDGLAYVGALNARTQVYEGSFDPAVPSQHAKYTSGDGYYSFKQGITYTLVVQDKCGNREGAWAVVLSGQGSVHSSNVVAVPNFTKGKFSSADPIMSFTWSMEGIPTRYKQSGPIRVSRTGTYYFGAIHLEGGGGMEVQIYTAPVNPSDQNANLVAQVPGGVPLQAGQDYYFVTHAYQEEEDGEYLYVLAPPTPLRINPGLSGTWYYPDTPGQGFFLTVYEKLNQVFLAWFTFTDNPAPDDEFGHRWMTAFGPFEGHSADLLIESTVGGAFNAAQPVPKQDVVGNMLLEFADCSSGQITYSWDGDESGSPPMSGVIPIRRHTDDSVALCESLYAGPGMPGPL